MTRRRGRTAPPATGSSTPTSASATVREHEGPPRFALTMAAWVEPPEPPRGASGPGLARAALHGTSDAPNAIAAPLHRARHETVVVLSRTRDSPSRASPERSIPLAAAAACSTPMRRSVRSDDHRADVVLSRCSVQIVVARSGSSAWGAGSRARSARAARPSTSPTTCARHASSPRPDVRTGSARQAPAGIAAFGRRRSRSSAPSAA
jgi:hypothetical protein